MTDPLRVGVIGCGIVARGHLKAIAESDDWTLAGVAEIDADRLEVVRGEHQPEMATTDYRELLAGGNLDAVVVATHADTHQEITCAAHEAGLHVLCEKPMADTVDRCRAMLASAEQSGKLLAINFNTRSGAAYRLIKKAIDDGGMGKIRVVRISYIWSAHQWQPPERLEHFMANGGPIIDSGVHFFEATRWFTGREFATIEASGAVLAPYEHPQHVIATCSLDDGAIALIEAGWLYTKRTKDAAHFYDIGVIGDDGVAHYLSTTNSVRVWTKKKTEELPCVGEEKHFELVHQFFAQSIREGHLVELASGEDGLKATEAAYQALAATKK